jgi:hypothetical protein
VKDQMTLFQFLKENSSVARVFYAAINDFLQRLKDAGGFDDFMARLKSMRVPVAPEGFLPVGPATAFYLNGEYFTLSFPKGKKRSLEVNSRKSINYYRWKGRAVVYFRKSGKIEINASARADDLAVIQLKTRRGHMMARVVKGEGFYYTSGQGSADKDYDADTSLAFNMLDFVIDNLSHDPAQLNTGGIDFRAGTVPLAVAGDGRGVISFDNDLEFIKRMQNIKGFSPVMMGMFLVDDLDDFSKNGFWGHRGR